MDFEEYQGKIKKKEKDKKDDKKKVHIDTLHVIVTVCMTL